MMMLMTQSFGLSMAKLFAERFTHTLIELIEPDEVIITIFQLGKGYTASLSSYLRSYCKLMAILGIQRLHSNYRVDLITGKHSLHTLCPWYSEPIEPETFEV